MVQAEELRKLNMDIYNKGFDDWYDQIESKIISGELREENTWGDQLPMKDVVEQYAWRAYCNDNHMIPTLELGYYVIAEEYGADMANEYWRECNEEV